jgi:hypothetical protein
MKKLILLILAGAFLFSSCVATVGYRYDPYPYYYPGYYHRHNPYMPPHGYYNYHHGRPFYPYGHWRHY